jgi:pantoate--beta-alanine ligase
MEGKFRPGHFDGVGTIVNALKLNLTLILAKRFQHNWIVKKWWKTQTSSTCNCPIHRENGLAMSSRNERLSPLKEKKLVSYSNLN